MDNSPALWLQNFPWPQNEENKYGRGHALVYGGPQESTGAARLAAISALRVGAGLVSVICDETALPIYASALTSVMTKFLPDDTSFKQFISSKQTNGILLGPGAGITQRTRDFILAGLNQGIPAVLDADVFTVFADKPADLFSAITGPCIFTPHEGEFKRLFPDLSLDKDRISATQQAAKRSRAVIVLKGAHTIISCPSGKTVVNRESTPFLATAGTGDVLAGLCLGLITQGMNVFDAACAAVWIHSQAALLIGPGLISEDLPEAIPRILSRLYQS